MSNKNTSRITAVSVLTVASITPVIAMVVNAIIPPSAAVNTYVDPAGRGSGALTGPFGEPLSVTDAAGLVTTTSRNSNGNPLSIVQPSGAVIDRTFDTLGNMLTIADQTLGGTIAFTYDATFSSVTQVTDPLSGQTIIQYDTQGNPTQLSTPVGRVLNATYQSSGVLASLTDTLGTVATVTYNADDLPTTIAVGSGADQRQGSRSYTAAGYVNTDTDALGRVFDLNYDTMGRVSLITLPDTRQIGMAYDPSGNLTSLTPPGRSAYGFSYNNVGLLASEQYPAVTGGGTNQMSYTYNPDRQLSQITRADGVNINIAYDSAGRLQTVTQPNGNFTVNYGASTGLIDSISSPDGITQSHTYNNELLTAVTWSGNVAGSVGYGYDAKGRITTLTIGGQNYTYAYNADDDITQAGQQTLSYDATSGLLTGTTLGTLNESYSYNQFAEISQHTVTAGATTLYDAQYTRDKLGRITQNIETIQGTTTTFDYSYDLAGRLSAVSQNGTLTNTYTYDTNDNLTDNGASYDAQDRITAQTGITYNHTAQGERSQKTQGANVTQYQYDAQGTLIGATLPNTDQIDYLLDGQSRRVVKQVNGTTAEAWLYAGNTQNPVARLNASNAVTQRYIYASRIQVPDYIDLGTTQYKVITDHLGSVRLIVNASNGSVMQRIDYDVWGNITSDNNPNFQPFAYAGGHYDNDTTLTHFGLREYDPKTAHWTSKDPIGFAGSSNNLYVYVSADPVNLIDPVGTDGIESAAGYTGGVLQTASAIAGFDSVNSVDIATKILGKNASITTASGKKKRKQLKVGSGLEGKDYRSSMTNDDPDLDTVYEVAPVTDSQESTDAIEAMDNFLNPTDPGKRVLEGVLPFFKQGVNGDLFGNGRGVWGIGKIVVL